MPPVTKHPRSARARIIRNLRFLHNMRGWHRIADLLVPEDPSLDFVARNGRSTFAGTLESFVDRQIYMYGGYEDQLIDAFLALIPAERRNTIVDVGANVGTHTLRFAQCFRQVIAFEPNPVVYAQLARNIALNRASNVELHRIGLADREAMLSFHVIDKPNHGLGTFATREQYDLPLRAVGQVPVTRGDVYLTKNMSSSVDAIKIDIQGYETEALRGLRESLREYRPYLWFEVGSVTRESIGTQAALRELLPYAFSLRRFGITNRCLWNHVRLVPVSSDDLDLGDYVAIPSDATRRTSSS